MGRYNGRPVLIVMKPAKPPVLTVATNNPHKLREFRRLFPGFQILAPGEVNCAFSYEETGTTYLENALGKAMHLHHLLDAPVQPMIRVWR